MVSDVVQSQSGVYDKGMQQKTQPVRKSTVTSLRLSDQDLAMIGTLTATRLQDAVETNVSVILRACLRAVALQHTFAVAVDLVKSEDRRIGAR